MTPWIESLANSQVVAKPNVPHRRAIALVAMPFSVGANLPWITSGGDFGANVWRPQGGLAAQGVSLDAFASLTELRGLGVETIRWFMFCDGRAGIRFDDDGSPLGLDEHVL